MRNKRGLLGLRNVLLLYLFNLISVLLPLFSFSQTDTTITLTFDFNDQEIKERNNKVVPKAANAFLAKDRFGNDKYALQLIGTKQSYLSLGTSPLLKSPNMSISLWIKINNIIYSGKGYEYNPVIGIRNSDRYDFCNALVISYDLPSGYIAAGSTKDSLDEVIAADGEPFRFNEWCHLVIVCNNKYLAFYKNGNLVRRVPKNFETTFLQTDSLVIGHSASIKNERYTRCIVDDIHIFHKSLSEKEVKELYEAPNPNKFWNVLNQSIKYLLVIFALIVLIIIILIRNKRLLKKQKEDLELSAKITELELRAIKSQMNPHFISNCLAAIQDLNYQADTDKANLYIAKFSFFLRQVLNYTDENYISISEEIIMIRSFIELEQLRFKNGFNYDLQIDPIFDAHDFLIPALITQPFIENAIWHGLLPLKNSREPYLIIRLFVKGNLPVIEVEDNGVGRNLTVKAGKKSKGTKLAMDKIEALNRLSKTSNYKIHIIDLKDNAGNSLGTKIVIELDNLKE